MNLDHRNPLPFHNFDGFVDENDWANDDHSGSARSLGKAVLATLERILGPEHEGLLPMLSVLVDANLREHRYDEADWIAERYHALTQDLEGADSIPELRARTFLAHVYAYTDLYQGIRGRRTHSDRSINILKDVVDVATRTLGNEHSETIAARNRLADTNNPFWILGDPEITSNE